QRARALRPHGYGFLELAIDESLLELGKVALRTARGVLPDGTPFDCPARDPLPPPLDVPATLRDSLVTLALPVRRPGVDEADLGGAGADSLARYVAGELEVKDSNAAFDRTALIQIGRLRLQLLKEADVTAAYCGLGVAKVIERRADLAGSFAPLIADIRRSLSMVLERNAIPIELQERSYGMRIAAIPDSDLAKTARFVLAAKAQLQPERLQASLPTLVKIGPVERIRDLVNLNLPGIALRSLPVAPRQIPYHAGFLYFELDRSGDLWKVTEQSRALAMHIAGEFPGLELEFWAVRGA